MSQVAWIPACAGMTSKKPVEDQWKSDLLLMPTTFLLPLLTFEERWDMNTCFSAIFFV